jgi:hypothetical protein
MSFNVFKESLEELEDLAFSNPQSMVNIIKLILPEKDIFKKVISEKIPGLSQEDIDLMSEAAFEEENKENLENSEIDNSESKEERIARKSLEKQKRKSKNIENKQNDKERRQKLKEDRENKLKKEKEKRKEELKKIYKDKWENFKLEIKELIIKIKNAIFQFFNRFLEVSKAFVLALIRAATSLPGAVVMIVSPPWNVPGAVTILLGVIISYLDILSKIQAIVPFLQPLRLLPNVVSDNDLKSTGITMNFITRTLIQFYGPILGLKNIIMKIIDWLKSLFGQSERRNKIFKQATKRLIKLGHIKSNLPRIVNVIDTDGDAKLKIHPGGSPIPENRRQPNLIERFDTDGSRFTIPSLDGLSEIPVSVYSWDSEDVEEILSLLEQFKITNTKKWGGESHVSDYRSDNSKVLNDLEDLQNKIDKVEIPKVDTSEFDQFVYDITLPDGTVIPNISEEGLEYYRTKFELEIINR